MSKNNHYPGYPRYVVIAFPKTGTKTLHQIFHSLGYKVFDVHSTPDYAKEFNQFGKEEIEFAELAKIFEENKYDVVIEPAGILWTYMVKHWPKTKFIHVTRDEESWKKSFTGFMGVIFNENNKTSIEHLLAQNRFISPAMNEAAAAIGGYAKVIVGADAYQYKDTTFEKLWPWPRYLTRMFRQFNAEVEVYAPKDRTLMNYRVKDGWPKLRAFIGIEGSDEEFPHANKGGDANQFLMEQFSHGEYRKRYVEDLTKYMAQFGITISTLAPQ